ncbi:5'/3'-nucleotidase SurE, partial [Acidithiobacillus ferriphilus]
GRDCTHFSTAAQVAAKLVIGVLSHTLPADTILNVNVPDLPYDEIRGFEVTRLGRRHKSDMVIPAADPRGDPVYWIGPSGREADAGPGTDFDAVRRGYVSITPLDLDMTRYNFLEGLSQWLLRC